VPKSVQARSSLRLSGGPERRLATRGAWMALLAVLALAVIVAGCGGGSDDEQQAATGSGGSKATELRKVKFRTNFVPEGNNAAFFYAVEQGYYRDEGLDVEILDGKGSGPTAQDVDAGNIEFGKVGSITLMQSNAEGAELVSVANINGRNSFGLIVPEDSPVQGVKDLVGRTVIVSAGSPETIYLPAALRQNGIDASKVKLLAVDSSAKTSVYASGKGDALATNIPFGIPVIQAKRPSRTIPFGDVGAPFPNYSLITQRELLDKEPDLVAGFLRATLKGQAEAANHPDAAVAALIKGRPQADPEVSKGQFEAAGEFTCSEGQSGKPQGYHSPEEWDAAARLLEKFGEVDPFDAAALYTNKFMDGPDSVSTFATCP
jgi:NitT/TauT family transport system substrate-binding protein